MGKTATIFVAGVITIGIITALTMNGRNSADVFKAAGTASSGLLGTAISGKSNG